MGIGTSIFLIAVGAIMRFAVSATTSGFSIHTAGLIIMLVGIAGLLISLLYAAIWADRRRGTVVEQPVVREREVR